jgi:hypothetical protein
LYDGLRTESSIESTKRRSLRTTSILESIVQDPVDKRLWYHCFAGIARIFRYPLSRTNCQLISFQIVRASDALRPVLQECSTINITQFIVSQSTNQADELAASQFTTLHGLLPSHQALSMLSCSEDVWQSRTRNPLRTIDRASNRGQLVPSSLAAGA